MTKRMSTSLVALALTAAVSACWADDGVKAVLGGGLGAAAGAAVGEKVGGNNGAVIGGAAGGALGAAATTKGSGRKGAIVGGAVGGAAGAAIGQQSGGKNGAIVGAGIGGAAGAGIGNSLTECHHGGRAGVAVAAQPVVVREAERDRRGGDCGHRPPGKAKGWSKHHSEC